MCRSLLRQCFSVLLCFTCFWAAAQGPAVRLGSRSLGGGRTPLPGSAVPAVLLGQDRGALADEERIDGVTLVFRPSAEQQAALDSLLSAQQDPGSPSYHRWLSPATFAERFGVAAEDLETVRAWLTGEGLRVEPTPPSHDRVTFSGTAAQLRAALGADLHRFTGTDGVSHFGPKNDLSLPQALVPLTAAVLHLDDIRPVADVQPAPRPTYTDNTTGANYLSTGDLAVMYDYGLVGYLSQGAGQTLAVVGQSFVNTGSNSSLAAFSFGTGNYQTNVDLLLVPNTGVQASVPGDLGESELDLEYATGMVPAAHTLLVYTGDSSNHNVFDALTYVVQRDLAQVISVSYTLCELTTSPTALDSFNAVLMQAAAQGQTVIAGSGDSGSTACAPFSGSNVTTAQRQALAVGFPASSPFVTAVGGTAMAAGTFGPGSSYWGSTGYGTSLLTYVPETTWNEGSPTRGIIAGGGGVSSHFARPAWQTGYAGMPSGATRVLPDVAMQASILSPGFLICTSDPYLLGSQSQSCTSNFKGSNNQYTVAGGTSFAAPYFAASVALLNQVQQTGGEGNLNPVLYSLAASPASYASAFHDITTGTIDCITGATNCTPAGQTGLNATSGFDQATGLGSVDVAHLRSIWPTAAGHRDPTLLVVRTSSVPLPLVPGSQVTYPISVQDSAPAPTPPTGSLQVSLDGVVVGGAVALPSEPYGNTADTSVSLTLPATSGPHVLQITYSGDTLHAGTSSTLPVDLGSLQASGTLALVASNVSISSGGSGASTVSITPGSGYHGEVLWSLAVTSASSQTTLCYSIAPRRVSAAATTQLLLGSGAACNAPLPSSGSALPAALPLVSAQATAHTAAAPPPHALPVRRPALALGFGLLGCALFRRKRLRGCLLLVLLTAGAAITLQGCGGSGQATGGTTTQPTTPVTPSVSTYTLSLTGKDSVNSSIVTSTSFTLTVN